MSASNLPYQQRQKLNGLIFMFQLYTRAIGRQKKYFFILTRKNIIHKEHILAC